MINQIFYTLKRNIKDIPMSLNVKTFGTGTVAAIICCTGPILIVITAAQNGELLHQQTISWLFGIYFFGGLIGILLPLLFRIPIAGAYSIPSAVLMTQAITQYSFTEAIGAYIITGVLIFIIGIMGWFEKILTWIPVELVMAMIAGSMLHFATNMIQSVFTLQILGPIIILSYFLFAKYFSKVPPILGAILIGIILFPFFEPPSTQPDFFFQLPSVWVPDFSIHAIIAISIPITLMLLGTEGAQGISMLKSAGYKVPSNKITMVNGCATMFAGIFGGHSACIGGIMSALCSSNDVGDKDKRYVAAIVSGVWLVLFGIFASIVLSFILILPEAFVQLIAGLALLGVLLNSLQKSFHGSHFQMGAFFSLIIAMSGINLYNISSTFWALVGGWLISWLIEKNDFRKRILAPQNTESTKSI